MSHPNVLFILIDALRADRCFGENKTAKTPNLDSLIKNGINCENAFSASDGTPISFSSIFTGMYPFKATERKGRWNFQLKKDVSDYVTILKKEGYTTLSTMPEMWVVNQFISLFDNDDKTYPLFGYRLYDGLGEDIVKKLKSKLHEPWFYFIHLMDAHKPIFYPEKFEKNEFGLDEYDKMISSIDEWIGKIMNEVNLENTIIVLTADHGDYLRVLMQNEKRISFEFKSYSKSALSISKFTPKFLYSLKNRLFLVTRDVITKYKVLKLGKTLTPYEKRALFNARSFPDRYIFDEIFHVPLILTGLKVPSGKAIKHQIRSVDIFPTILELCNITDANIKRDGKSIVPIINNKENSERISYMESGFNLKDPSKAVIGIRTSNYKYFRLADSKNNVHLYDLKNDPNEEINIASISNEIVQKMENILVSIRESNININEKEFLKKKIAEKKSKVSL